MNRFSPEGSQLALDASSTLMATPAARSISFSTSVTSIPAGPVGWHTRTVTAITSLMIMAQNDHDDRGHDGDDDAGPEHRPESGGARASLILTPPHDLALVDERLERLVVVHERRGRTCSAPLVAHPRRGFHGTRTVLLPPLFIAAPDSTPTAAGALPCSTRTVPSVAGSNGWGWQGEHGRVDLAIRPSFPQCPRPSSRQSDSTQGWGGPLGAGLQDSHR